MFSQTDGQCDECNARPTSYLVCEEATSKPIGRHFDGIFEDDVER